MDKFDIPPMNDVEEECFKFMTMMGHSEWGEDQRNSMSASFYGGALVAFIIMHNSVSKSEDGAIEVVDKLYNDINKNIISQRDLMFKLMGRKSPFD